jgi:ferredoxin
MDSLPTYLPRAQLQALIDGLLAAGYRVLGPVLEQDVIQYRPLDSASQLPRGVHDQQAPGRYRITTSDSARQFAWANGPQALKPLLFAPTEPLWRVTRDADGALGFTAAVPDTAPTAVIGVRACDLAALKLQDRHFLEGNHPDPYYRARRDDLLLVAVDCAHPADTCFCASTGDGPGCDEGADIVLTELDDGFVLWTGTARGRAIADPLGLAHASAQQVQTGKAGIAAAAATQLRQLPGADLPATLFAKQADAHWDAIAERCLACGNCTLVCPSCFCHRSEETPALGGASSEHSRVWDSCFSSGHGHLHGGHLRETSRDQYRQWLTHKFAGWVEQYGRSGCTGCGRCISWCPVGIDVTVELAALCGEAAGGDA